jgi:malonyl-CoA O-methyltransferase
MLVAALEGHRMWAASYRTAPNPLLALEDRLLPQIMGPVAFRRVVDVACGTGRWVGRLAEWGAHVVGIDFCAEMLEQAPWNVHTRLVLGDAVCLPIRPATADLTICSFAAAYFPDLERAVWEMARITKPGGRPVISNRSRGLRTPALRILARADR